MIKVLSQIEGGARRLAEIVKILAKYGLADWLDGVDNQWIEKHLTTEVGENIMHRPKAERARLALTELGVTGIKLGQLLSTRADLVGSEMAMELGKLQADLPPDPAELIFATIRKELGPDYEEAFDQIEEEPIASASIGQVHRATLRGGEEVVVKVMHAGIEERVRRDLDIMMFLGELLERHSPTLRRYRPLATAKSFRTSLLREMDFCYEMRHLQRFTKNFAGDSAVKFPTDYPELSAERVLTMGYLQGVSVADGEALRASGEDLDEFARRGATLYLEMIFRDGFYHADPHPGNLFLLEGGVVGMVDCGMVGNIDATLRDEIEGMLIAAVATDPAELVDIVCRVGQVPPELDRGELQRELSGLLADCTQQSLDHFDLGGALARVTDLIRGFHIILPSGFTMLLKTLAMLEGTARQFSPSFNLAELLAPYYAKVLRRRLAPKKLLGDAAKVSRDWGRMVSALPADLGDILSRLRAGSFEVHLEHRRLEGTVDRLVKGILVAALFLGSSLMLSSEVPPTFHGLSVLGLVGVISSIALAIPLLRTIGKNAGRK